MTAKPYVDPPAGPAPPPLDAAELLAAQSERRLIVTEYPYRPERRAFETSRAGARLAAMCDAAAPHIGSWLANAAVLNPQTREIAITGEGVEPGWVNGMLPGLDSLMLYAMIRTQRPATYLEIGSGNSTRFVRRAIRDGGLSTRIVSVDPAPRAEVETICDEVIRRPFEGADPDALAGMLREGDMVFIDNSHRSFQNSDVTVAMTELLPILPAGTLYGLHDIWLPFDYPEDWADRFYNEQYLLAAYLLGGAGGDEVEFPAMYVSRSWDYADRIADLFSDGAFDGVARHGAAFWLRRS